MCMLALGPLSIVTVLDVPWPWNGASTVSVSPARSSPAIGPAPAGENAGVQVWLSEQGKQPTSPRRGAVTLTPEQQRQLGSGMWCVNIHTANNPGGAIRGR